MSRGEVARELLDKYLSGFQPAALVVARDVSSDSVDHVDGESVVASLWDRSESRGVLVAERTADGASVLAETVGHNLTEQGGKAAVCELSCWKADPSTSYERALNVEDVLAQRNHELRTGFLRPEIEVLASSPYRFGRENEMSLAGREGGENRVAAESVAREYLGRGDMLGAGFVLFEVNESPEQRRRWLGGLMSVIRDVSDDRATTIAAAETLLNSDSTLGEVASETYETFLALRTGPAGYLGALAELCVQVLHNMAWWSDPSIMPPFDRDTGWAIAPTALRHGQDAGVRAALLEALFPLSSGLWD